MSSDGLLINIIPRDKGKLYEFAELFLILCLTFIFNSAAQAESDELLKLENKNDIETAAGIYDAIQIISEKVMACVKANNGKTEGCICLNENSCKFKYDFRNALYTYCEAIKQNPEWNGKMLYYEFPGDPNGYNLSITGLEKQFGSYCK